MLYRATPIAARALDDAFTRLSGHAQTGAYGANDRQIPTDAQAKAGTYKKGRTKLHGLSIAIEQPQGSIRTGVSQDGKEWSCRMAAHYGYFERTKGADGDGVDVFIGPYPESRAVFVINQRNKDGSFDEHKVMLGFDDEDSARRAYLASYERGWTGLQSIVPLTISQLAWWLKNGNKHVPVTAKALPHDGTQAMTKKVFWNDAAPEGMTFDQVLYEVRRADGADGLLLDAVTIADILEDSEGVLALDALVVENAQLSRMAERLRLIMDRAGQDVKAPAVQVTEPFKNRGVTNVAAVFELSDGQTVSVFFHNPDTTPNKLAPGDEMISWKWLLNKRDITIVVAPEKGQDLNPRMVAQRIMKLAEKNSAAFARANSKRAERLGNIQAIRDRIAEKEGVLKGLLSDIEVAQRNKDERDAAAKPDPVMPAVSELPVGWTESAPGGMATNKDPEAGGIVDTNLASGKWFAVANKGGVKVKGEFDTREEAMAALSDAIANYRFDPLAPENYSKVLADQALQLAYQDELDSYFQGRLIDVRNALRGMGWVGDKYAPLMKNDAKLEIHTQRIGAGGNVVGIKYYVTGNVAQGGSDATQDLPEFTALEIAQDIDTKVKAAPEVDPIAQVDAAYQFANATDAFKERVAASIEKPDYSEFATAKAMDMKAKALGAEIHWGMGAALDSVAEGEDDEDDFDPEAEFDACPVEDAELDGDFKGHPFRGNQHKKASQHSHAAVRASMSAKHAERDGDAKGAKSAHKSAHYSHMAAAEGTTGKARKYHRKMAKFHAGRAGLALDSVALDDIEDFNAMNIVGRIFKGGELKGHAVIGGDGKAMVFVGDDAYERVHWTNPENGERLKALWSDDDAADMVEWLLVPVMSPAKKLSKKEAKALAAAEERAAAKANAVSIAQQIDAVAKAGLKLPDGISYDFDIRRETTWKAGGPGDSISFFLRDAKDAGDETKFSAEARIFLDEPRVILFATHGSVYAGQPRKKLIVDDFLKADGYEELAHQIVQALNGAIEKHSELSKEAGTVEVFAFADASDEARSLLRIGAMNPAKTNAYNTAKDIEQLAVSQGMAVRWEAVETIPAGDVMDDASGGLFGTGDRGHIGGELTYKGKRVAGMFLREDGLVHFTFDRAVYDVSSSNDADVLEGWDGLWSDNWHTIVSTLGAIVAHGFMTSTDLGAKGFRPALEMAGWSAFEGDFYVHDSYRNVGIEVKTPEGQEATATLRAYVGNGKFEPISEASKEDVMEVHRVLADASGDELQSVIYAIGTDAKTLQGMVDAGQSIRQQSADPVPAAPADNVLTRLQALKVKAPKGAIASDDPAAIEKLQAKIDYLSAYGDMMREANKLVRKQDRAGLAAMGFNEVTLEGLFKADFAGRKGFPDYEMSNNNAEIRRSTKRMEELIERVRQSQHEPAPEPTPEPAPVNDPKIQDRAFLMTVIDGSAPDMLEPDLAARIEDVFTRNSEDAEMVSLFSQAVNAYTQAMLAATAGV